MAAALFYPVAVLLASLVLPGTASPLPANREQIAFPLVPSQWLPPRPKNGTGTGHFSEWSRNQKSMFIDDLVANNADDWIIVTGNEGGDLDSMASALSWAYHLTHLSPPQKAVALLQTEEDALDLRPENKLALHYAHMAPYHNDLLTIDELPVKPFDIWHRIKGLALVDHNVPRSIWGNVTVVSIIDHHEDRGTAPSASPRVLSTTASCSSLVSDIILDHIEGNDDYEALHGPLPPDLVELLMRTIAIDSSGLKEGSSQEVDVKSATRLLARSQWAGEDLRKTMKALDKELSDAKDDLDTLDLRALLKRDWKGDAVETKSSDYPTLSIGFASIPYSMEEQIERTPEGTAPEWFAVERAYTAEVGVDVSIVLSKHKHEDGKKVRGLAIVVAHGLGKRLSGKAADSLFEQLVSAVEDAPDLEDLNKWKRPDGKDLLPRRAVWTHRNNDVGRKQIRPIIEKAAMAWAG